MNTTALAGTTRRAGARQWIGLGVLALPTILLALDITVLYLALPQLVSDLKPTNNQTLWMMDIYGFMIAGWLVTMGTLGDRIGRRRLLLIGAGAFGAASVLAAYAPSAELLILARALLGIAGATLMPSTLALLRNMFHDPRQLGLAIGVWASSFSVGIAIGPVVGGALLESFWWGSVFLLGVPVMVLLLITGPLVLPEYRDPTAGRLDLASVALSLGTVLPIIYGIKEIAGKGTVTGWAALAIGVGVLAGIWFARRQRRLTSPLLDLRLFRNRNFSVALAVLLLALLGTGGIYLFVTQYLQLVEGLSPLHAGLWLLPAAFTLVIVATVAPIIARRVRPGYVVAAALGLATVGYLLLTQVDNPSAPISGVLMVAVGFLISYIGTAAVMALGTDLVVSSAPPDQAGSVSAVSETATEFGVAFGIAALGSIGATVYRSRFGDGVAGVPAEVNAAAHDSLANASAAAAALPTPVGNQLLDAAQGAFISGMHTAAAIGAGVTAVLAVVCVVMLRHTRPTGEVAEPGAGAHADADSEAELVGAGSAKSPSQ